MRIEPPDHASLGTTDAPVPWDSLSISEKLTCLHDLCEWQLEAPESLRRVNDSEDEAVTWRVLPAGWDRQGNTYWLFDDNRLWIQRVPPKRLPKSKAKRALPSKKGKAKAKKARPTPPPSRPAGRRSSRLSGADASGIAAPKESVKSEDIFDSDSELSPPPDEDDDEYETAMANWIEFETICVTRSEWEAFAERYAQSKHPDERALHNYINKEVLPPILELIQAEEKRLAMEAALSNRKRSSRIAMRDSEREQREREEAELREQRARAAAALRAERDRELREKAQRPAQQSREDRLRERGERLLARERMIAERNARAEQRRGEAHNMDVDTDAQQNKVEECVNHSAPMDTESSAPMPGQETEDARAEQKTQIPMHAESLTRMHAPPMHHGPNVPQSSASAQQVSPRSYMMHRETATNSAKTPLHMSPAGSPIQHVRSPGNTGSLTSPRGSFPLRMQHMRSPLSQAVAPDAEPSPTSLHLPPPQTEPGLQTLVMPEAPPLESATPASAALGTTQYQLQPQELTASSALQPQPMVFASAQEITMPPSVPTLMYTQVAPTAPLASAPSGPDASASTAPMIPDAPVFGRQ